MILTPWQPRHATRRMGADVSRSRKGAVLNTDKGPREIVSRAHSWPGHIPIRIGSETRMLNEVSDQEFADAVIRWLQPFASPAGRAALAAAADEGSTSE